MTILLFQILLLVSLHARMIKACFDSSRKAEDNVSIIVGTRKCFIALFNNIDYVWLLFSYFNICYNNKSLINLHAQRRKKTLPYKLIYAWKYLFEKCCLKVIK